MTARPQNWVRFGEFLPIDTLSDSYAGPVVLADESQTVQWFAAKANKDAVEHVEHERGDAGELLFDGVHRDGSQKPKLTKPTTIHPAFWAVARMVD